MAPPREALDPRLAAGGGFPQWNLRPVRMRRFAKALYAAVPHADAIAFCLIPTLKSGFWFPRVQFAHPNTRYAGIEPTVRSPKRTRRSQAFSPSSADVDSVMGPLHLPRVPIFFVFAWRQHAKHSEEGRAKFLAYCTAAIHLFNGKSSPSTGRPWLVISRRVPASAPAFVCVTLAPRGSYPDYASERTISAHLPSCTCRHRAAHDRHAPAG